MLLDALDDGTKLGDELDCEVEYLEGGHMESPLLVEQTADQSAFVPKAD